MRVWVATGALLGGGLLGGPLGAEASASSVSAGQWSAAVCQAIGRWDAQLQKLNSSKAPIPGSDLAAGKQAIASYLAAALKATTRLGRDIQAAGVPAVKNGSAITAAFAHSVQSLHATYAKAASDAAALPTTDPAGFATAARAIASTLQTAGTDLTSAVDHVSSLYAPALEKALAANKTCRSVL